MENKELNPAVELKNSIDTAIETKGAEIVTETKEAILETKSALEDQMTLQAKSMDDLTNTVNNLASQKLAIETKSTDLLLDGLKSLDFSDVRTGKGSVELELKSLSYGSTGNEGAVPFEYRVEEIKTRPHHKTRARNIVMTGMTSGDLVRFNQSTDTAATNPAAGKAHGATFGDYSTQLDNKEEKVVTYGAKITLNEEQLDDVLGLRSFITNQLNSYLMDTEDAYIIQGTGSANNQFSGIFAAGTTFSATQVIGATANLYDVILDSAAQLAALNYNLDAVVLNATDYWHLATIKTTQGEYALRTFQNDISPKVLGADIYWNNGLTAGNFIAFDKMATQFWMREGATVEFFRNGTDFVDNNVTARVKARGCVTNFLPSGIIKGVIATAITDLTS